MVNVLICKQWGLTMKVRLKKQNRHEVESVNQTGIQAKSLTDIRPMDNALATPHQTPNRRREIKKYGEYRTQRLVLKARDMLGF